MNDINHLIQFIEKKVSKTTNKITLAAYRVVTKELENMKRKKLNSRLPKKELFDKMVLTASRKYGVTVADIMTRTRFQPICEARQYAMYLMYEHDTDTEKPKLNGKFIALNFLMDHATVYHACKVMKIRIEHNQTWFDIHPKTKDNGTN